VTSDFAAGFFYGWMGALLFAVAVYGLFG